MNHDHLWNKDLERAVLGVVLDGRHPAAWGTMVEHLPHPGYFFSRDHQLIYLAISALADRGERIDASAVATECAATVWRDAAERLQWLRMIEDTGQAPDRKLIKLPPPADGLSYDDSLLVAVGGFNAVTDLAEVVAPAASLARNCQLVADHYRQRRLLKLLGSAVKTLESPKGVRAVREVGGDLINGAAKELGLATSDVTMGDALARALDQHDLTAAEGGARVASWGIPSLDARMPLNPDSFTVLAAPSSVGKTSLAMQAIEATAEIGGVDSVSVVSREMGPEELARIVVARRLGIPANSVRDGTLTRGERERIQAEAERWRTTQSVVIQRHAAHIGVKEICSWARLRHVRSAGRMRLIVIDHLHMLSRAHPRQTEYDCLSEATFQLKQLQIELRVPILLLAQVNREGSKASRGASGALGAAPEPQLSDLRGSGTIEQDANNIVFLWPREPPTSSTQAVSIKLAKNRAGPVGVIDCRFMRAAGQVFREVQVEAMADRGRRLETAPSDDEDVFG